MATPKKTKDNDTFEENSNSINEVDYDDEDIENENNNDNNNNNTNSNKDKMFDDFVIVGEDDIPEKDRVVVTKPADQDFEIIDDYFADKSEDKKLDDLNDNLKKNNLNNDLNANNDNSSKDSKKKEEEEIEKVANNQNNNNNNINANDLKDKKEDKKEKEENIPNPDVNNQKQPEQNIKDNKEVKVENNQVEGNQNNKNEINEKDAKKKDEPVIPGNNQNNSNNASNENSKEEKEEKIENKDPKLEEKKDPAPGQGSNNNASNENSKEEKEEKIENKDSKLEENKAPGENNQSNENNANKEEVDKDKAARIESAENELKHQIEVFNVATHQNVTIDDIYKEVNALTDNVKDVPENYRQQMLEQNLNEFYKDNLNDLLMRNNSLSKDGKQHVSGYKESFDRLNDLFGAITDVMKEKGQISKDYDVLAQKNISGKEVKDIMSQAYHQGPRNQKDRDAILGIHKDLAEKQQVSAKGGFKDYLNDFNKEMGTNFSARGTVGYLTGQFRSSKGTSIDEMQSDFKDKYQEFLKAAYKNLLNKSFAKGEKNIEEIGRKFDEYTKNLEGVLKEKGFIDSKEQHQLFGLGAGSLNEMNKEFMKTQPKNLVQKTQLDINNARVNDACKMVNDKLKDMVKNNKLADLKNAKEFPDDVKDSLSCLKALNERQANQSRWQKIRHPFQNRRMNNTLKNAINTLKANGVEEAEVNSMIKAVTESGKDKVSENYEKNMNCLNDLTNLQKSYAKASELRVDSVTSEKKHPGVKIELKELDPRQDIVNSKDMVMDKDLELDKNLKLENANEKENPQGPAPSVPGSK